MILIVEDEFLIALDIENLIIDCGLSVYGPYDTVGDALDAIITQMPLCAILDVRLPDGDIFPVADKLYEKHVPIIFHSGHANVVDLQTRYPSSTVCQKPASLDELKLSLMEAVKNLGNLGLSEMPRL